MEKRVRCLTTRAHRGAPIDPYLTKGKFYTVVDEDIITMADETPYIRVTDGVCDLERPRHMFSRVLTS